MAFLRSATPEDFLAPLYGDRVLLRAPSHGDYAEWANLRAQSKARLTRWEPSWLHDDLSRPMYRRRMRVYARDVRDDASYVYFITERATGLLVGGITVSNVRRGAAQSASLGYWMGTPHVGRGYMTEAVGCVVRFAFDGLRLHRLEAASMPDNAASLRVLEKSGFEPEGRVRGYLKINGRWEDHILYSRLAPCHETQSAERPTATLVSGGGR